MKIRVLSAAEVRAALPMREAMDAVREALVALSAGQAVMPVRTRVDVERTAGIGLTMPAYLAGPHELATKLVSVFPGNLERRPSLPTIHALVVVFDADTGLPAGVMDGGSLTAIRTGAASGVATEELARADVETAGMLGAGVQARTQLEAMLTARPGIRRAFVFDPRTPAAEAYATEMSDRLRIPVEALGSADAVVERSDVIAEATTATTPVFADRALRDDAHLNAVGSFTPAMQIVPEATVVRASVVVDHRESAWEEAGDLIQPRDRGAITEEHVLAEIGEICAGTKPKPTTGPTLFKTVGTAVQDVSAGSAALRRAEERGLGTVIEL